MKAFVAASSLLALATADPFYGYGPYRALGGAGLHPTGASYSNRSPQGLGKREADALGLGAGGFIRQTRPELAPVGLPVVGTFTHPVGKRDAEADASIYAPYVFGGVAAHPTGISYTQRTPQGLGKREAEPFYGYGPYRALGGAGLHPTGASYSNRSPQGLGKREAEPFYGYGPYRALGGAGLHPTGASYSNRSPQGLGKREAEPFYGYGPYRALGGAGLHPTGASYSNRSPQGLGKRDADAEALGLGAGGFIRQARPYAAFGIHHNGVGAFAHPVGKRDADAFYAPVLAKGYPSWPGVVAPGFESTCYGCGLGKREAVEEPKALATHPNGGTSFVGETVWGFPVAKAVEKRDADPAVSYSNRSPQGAYGPAPYYWG